MKDSRSETEKSQIYYKVLRSESNESLLSIAERREELVYFSATHKNIQ